MEEMTALKQDNETLQRTLLEGKPHSEAAQGRHKIL